MKSHEARANVFLDKLRVAAHQRRISKTGSPRRTPAGGRFQLHRHRVRADSSVAKRRRRAPSPRRRREEYERPQRENAAFRERRDDRGAVLKIVPPRNARYRDDRRPSFDNRRDERPRRFEDRPPRAESKFAAPKKSKTDAVESRALRAGEKHCSAAGCTNRRSK